LGDFVNDRRKWLKANDLPPFRLSGASRLDQGVLFGTGLFFGEQAWVKL
jgi:hypothetical protein